MYNFTSNLVRVLGICMISCLNTCYGVLVQVNLDSACMLRTYLVRVTGDMHYTCATHEIRFWARTGD